MAVHVQGIQQRGLTQAQAGEIRGIKQPKSPR